MVVKRWGVLVALARAGCGKAAGSPAASDPTEPLVVRDAQFTVAAGALPGRKAACPAADKVVLVEPLYDASDESAPPIGWNGPLAARPAPTRMTPASISPPQAKAHRGARGP